MISKIIMEKFDQQQPSETAIELREDIDSIGRLLEWPRISALWREEKDTIEERRQEQQRTKNNKFRNNWFALAFGIIQLYPEFSQKIEKLMAEFKIHQDRYQGQGKEKLMKNLEYLGERSELIDKTDELLVEVRRRLLEKLKQN